MERMKIKCKVCDNEIEVRYKRDFIGCSCFYNSGGKAGCSIDAGLESGVQVFGEPINILKWNYKNNTWEELILEYLDHKEEIID